MTIWWAGVAGIAVWTVVLVATAAFTSFCGRRRDEGDAAAEQMIRERGGQP